MDTVIGIDIGGTNTKIGLVQTYPKAEVIDQKSIETCQVGGVDVMVQRIVLATTELIEHTGMTPVGVGVGCPGVISPKEGLVRKSPNIPALTGFPLRDELESWFKLPVAIQNDANAAVLGEYLFGPNKQLSDLILLTLGTGIGGGVIVGGRLLQGADDAAAELGHLKVDPNGAQCGCGRKGCVEAYAGAAGIARLADGMLEIHLASGQSSLLAGEILDTKAIAEAAELGDAFARTVLEKVGEYLGRGIGLMIDTFNPEKVLLGGGASAAFEFLRPGIDRGVAEFASFPETRDRTIIEQAAFPHDINLLGAAATFVNSQRPRKADEVELSPTVIQPMASSNGELVLGIHIGASSCHAGLLTTSGEVVSRDYRSGFGEDRREAPYEDLLDEAVDASMKAIAKALANGAELDSLAGFGLVVPAPVDNYSTGHVGRAPALRNLKNKTLGTDLSGKIRQRLSDQYGSTRLQLPGFVANDADGACLAELCFGEARNQENFFTAHLCSGIGGSIVLDGKLYRGNNRCAGEFGHITVQPDGESCNCGGRGCLETIVSGQALIKDVQSQGLTIGGRHRVHYCHLITAANSGEDAILDMFERMGRYLGIGVASIINMLNPAKVVFTGKLASAYPHFWPAAEREILRRVFVGLDCPVVCSQQTEDSEVRSALSIFLYYRESQHAANRQETLRTV